MILCIADVLSRQTAARMADAFDGLQLEDGRLTAGWLARGVKKNRQAVDSPQRQMLAEEVRSALLNHPLISLAARPRSLRLPLLSAYGVGEGYGAHVDDALMGDPPVRTDLSVTVFLSAPEAYDGGELVIDQPGGEQSVKLPAGSAVLYPSTTLHRVEPVTRGERRVAVSWMQSFLRDAEQRELLFDLDRARRSLHEQHGRTPEGDLLAKVSANLLRRWAEV
jgi:PKHD-type hydroxylase